jgi:hypothetical protein
MQPNYWLVATSSMFIIPSIYGYYKGNRMLGSVSLCTALCSINYWMNPVEGTRKNIDLFVSKITSVTYVIYGYNNINSSMIKLISYTNLLYIINLYYLSCSSYNKNSDTWLYYHIYFHLSIVFGKILVLL